MPSTASSAVDRRPRPSTPLLALRDVAPAFTRRDVIIAAVLTAVFIAARLGHLGSFRLWFDEIFTLETGRRDWRSLLWFVQRFDEHPPLFYLLVNLWVRLGGESFAWLGLLPSLAAIATLAPLWRLAKELRMSPAEWHVTLALMALNGFLVGYAEEFRVYSWLMLLSVTSMWLFVRFCNASDHARGVVPLAIVNLVMVYTHYYGWLLVGTEGLFLLFWSWRKTIVFALASAAAVAAYLPWALLVLRATAARVAAGERAMYFIPRPDVFSVAFFYGALNGLFDIPHTTLAGDLLFSFPVLAWVAAAWRRRGGPSPPVNDRAALAWLMLAATVPVVIAFVVSRISPAAIWGQRHLIIVAAPYYVLLSAALCRLPRGVVRSGAIAAALAWATVTGVQAQVSPYKVPAWDRLVDYVVSQTPPGQPARIYSLNEDAAFPMRFYLARAHRPEITIGVLQQATARNRERFEGDSPAKPYWALSVPVTLVDNVRELGAGRIWICDDRDDAALLGRPRVSLRQLFADADYTVGPEFSTILINRRWNARRVAVFPAEAPSSRGRSARR